MNNDQLKYGVITLAPEPEVKQETIPSYFEHNARRTLPGDKKVEEFRRLLKQRYVALELEYHVRRMKRS